MGIKPEDVLPDGENYAVVHGVSIRKGTMGAALANVDILISESSTVEEKESAKEALKEIALLMKNTSFKKHLAWKNAAVQNIFDSV